jgi:hypothetical protein
VQFCLLLGNYHRVVDNLKVLEVGNSKTSCTCDIVLPTQLLSLLNLLGEVPRCISPPLIRGLRARVIAWFRACDLFPSMSSVETDAELSFGVSAYIAAKSIRWASANDRTLRVVNVHLLSLQTSKLRFYLLFLQRQLRPILGYHCLYLLCKLKHCHHLEIQYQRTWGY